MASHELRTPLAGLRAELDLADSDGNASLADYRGAIREAQADAMRLTTLTASLLEFGRDFRRLDAAADSRSGPGCCHIGCAIRKATETQISNCS